MKHHISILLAICLTLPALARAGNFENLTYDGSARTQSVQLSSELSHQESRIDRVAETCFREVLDGEICETVTREVCHDQPGRCRDERSCDRVKRRDGTWEDICHTKNVCEPSRRVCLPESRRQCRPVYRNEPYTCYKEMTVVYNVKDADTIGNIQVEMLPLQGQGPVSAQVQVALQGSTVFLSGSTNQVVLLANLQQQVFTGRARIVETSAKAAISALSLDQVRAAIQLDDMRVGSDNLLSFSAGNDPQVGARFHLRITRARALIKDSVVFDRVLTPQEYTKASIGGGRGVITADLNRLGLSGELRRGKFTFKVSADAIFAAAEVLNAREIKHALAAERNIEVKR